ncbi:MAG TPA: nuclear transport factor 2 family protein [Croceibacterium sp.]|nr:nuclear transport factor 2 family protein [Croceibacterium sp.]
MSADAKQPTYARTYAEDRAEIEDLMARYLFAIDYFDWDSYVETFAPDGELTFASGTSKGRDAIRAAVTSFSSRIGQFYHTEDGKPAKLRHVVLQSSIRVEGTHAWGRTLWVEMANHGPGDTMKMGTYGIYEDEFVKLGGHWFIAKRNVLNEFIKGRNSGPGNPVRDMDAAAEALKK